MNIAKIKHKKVRRFYEKDETKGLAAEHIDTIRAILTAMEAAEKVSDIGLFPGWRVHRLKGDKQGQWAVSVSGNWRITFIVNDDGDIEIVDYGDYH